MEAKVQGHSHARGLSLRAVFSACCVLLWWVGKSELSSPHLPGRPPVPQEQGLPCGLLGPSQPPEAHFQTAVTARGKGSTGEEKRTPFHFYPPPEELRRGDREPGEPKAALKESRVRDKEAGKGQVSGGQGALSRTEDQRGESTCLWSHSPLRSKSSDCTGSVFFLEFNEQWLMGLVHTARVRKPKESTFKCAAGQPRPKARA